MSLSDYLMDVRRELDECKNHLTGLASNGLDVGDAEYDKTLANVKALAYERAKIAGKVYRMKK